MAEITTFIQDIMSRSEQDGEKTTLSHNDYMELVSCANAWVADWEQRHNRNYKDFNDQWENEKAQKK